MEHATKEELADNYFVCWEKADIPFQLGRFFYQDKDDGKYGFHLEMHITSRNFDGYKFSDNGSLEKLRDKLGKNARIDFLVEDGTVDLLSVCGEAKYFRYSIEGVARGDRTVLDSIEEDFEKLKAFTKYEICRYAGYTVLDKYYHRNKPKTWSKVKSKLDKMSEAGITVLMKEV